MKYLFFVLALTAAIILHGCMPQQAISETYGARLKSEPIGPYHIADPVTLPHRMVTLEWSRDSVQSVSQACHHVCLSAVVHQDPCTCCKCGAKLCDTPICKHDGGVYQTSMGCNPPTCNTTRCLKCGDDLITVFTYKSKPKP